MLLNEDGANTAPDSANTAPDNGANTAPDRGVAALRAVVHALSRPKGAKVTLARTLTLALTLTPNTNTSPNHEP